MIFSNSIWKFSLRLNSDLQINKYKSLRENIDEGNHYDKNEI